MDINTDNFSDRMLKEFPDLFPKDEAGNPTQPSCGFYCPAGWEALVEHTCLCLNSMVKNPQRKQTWITWYKASKLICNSLLLPICNKLYRLTDPAEKLRWKDGVRMRFISLNKERIDAIHNEHPVKSKLNKWVCALRRFCNPTYRSKLISCSPVTIEQVKEKFGTLRFYAYGGDARTRAVISFAESMSGLICEETGATGKLVSRGGWYKTLSPEVAKSSGYK